MTNKFENLIAALLKTPATHGGYSAKAIMAEAKNHGVTCREVVDIFLGKERSIGYSVYPAALDEAALVMIANPVEKKKRGRKPGVSPKTPRVPKAKLTLGEAPKMLEPEVAESRKNLIAEIARRHANVNTTAADLEADDQSDDQELSETDEATLEEVQKVLSAASEIL